MLKIESDGKAMKGLEAEGTPAELAAELGNAVSGIYNAMRKNNRMAAELFRLGVQTAVSDVSPVRKEEDVIGTAIVMMRPRRKEETE